MESNSWGSYPKIFALGHNALAALFCEPVLIEEKIDGSQFSAGVFDGKLRCRSKNVELDMDGDCHMFNEAVGTMKGLAPRLHDGWTYRCEYLQKPKHNALGYDRIPQDHLIIYDINDGHQSYLSYDAKAAEAERLGLEVVPRLHDGLVENVGALRDLFDGKTSLLGGCEMEGIVVKNYERYGRDGKVLMGKFVSGKYKEVHNREWKNSNPKSGDILEQLKKEYCTGSARWEKAVIHRRERGELLDAPTDIGPLMGDVAKDLHEECCEEIEGKLFKWAWKHLSRTCTSGLAQWYKDRLLDNQEFGGSDDT